MDLILGVEFRLLICFLKLKLGLLIKKNVKINIYYNLYFKLLILIFCEEIFLILSKLIDIV